MNKYGLKELVKQNKLKPNSALKRLLAKAEQSDGTTKFAAESRTGKWLMEKTNLIPN